MKGHTILEIWCEYSLNLKTTRKLYALKHRLTDLLICFISWVEALPIHGNLRYIKPFHMVKFSVSGKWHRLYSLGTRDFVPSISIFKGVILIKLSSSEKIYVYECLYRYILNFNFYSDEAIVWHLYSEINRNEITYLHENILFPPSYIYIYIYIYIPNPFTRAEWEKIYIF